ncbi:MAG: hypothetical protein PUB05_04210 [Firmicutes bacterium]|nr:hypothetical protein [Bacillota bacterium]
MSNKPTTGVPTPSDLQKINKLARRPLTEDDVYVFPVTLCDNEIDRDNERFSIDALHGLAKLFVGKTGISDHSMRSSDQTARIFDCTVESVSGQTTAAGEVYHKLCAKAYVPRSDKYKDFINEIDTGIKKEVSVGCSTASRRCSICGNEIGRGPCNHRVGRSYTVGGKRAVCHAILGDPTDAYEWSFVAVPAQRAAGVTKGYAPTVDGIIKNLRESGLPDDIVERLESSAAIEQEYRDQLCNRAVKACMIANPELSADTIRCAAERMDCEQLKGFADAYERAAAKILPPRPQLFAQPEPQTKADNNYII